MVARAGVGSRRVALEPLIPQVPVRSSRERLAGFLHSVPQAQDKWKIIDPKLEAYVVLETRSPKHILAYRVTAVRRPSALQ